MIKRSIHGYFWFGTCVRYLQDVSARSFLGEEEDWLVIGNLARFFTYLDNLNLQVTKIASADLRALYRELAQLDPELGLSQDQAQSLASEVRSVRNTLEAELRGLEAYVVTPKRMDVDRLLEDISSLLSPHVFNKLPPIAQFDLSESGKCIAFERPTASAFHLLRATEAVLREFYCAIVLRGRVGLMWGGHGSGFAQEKKSKAIRGLDQ